MCIPFREQLEAKDQRIATLEAQLAAKDQTIAKLCKDLAIANSKLAEAKEFLAPLMRDGYDYD